MKTPFRFRMYQNHKQEQRLLRMIGAGQRLWNDALAHRKHGWEEQQLSTSYGQQSRLLTRERQTDPPLRELYAQAGQEILRRLARAFEAFFENKARYPRFKKFSGSGSFTYPQAYNGSVKPDAVRKRLFLSKAGDVKVVFHRPLPQERLKTCTAVRESNGEWYVCLVYEYEVPVPVAPMKFVSPGEIDLGLKSLITTTDGVKVQHPLFLLKDEIRLKRLQQRLSKSQKGSKNRGKARRLLAVQSLKISRKRGDFNHKLSAELVKTHDLVVFENPKVRNMVRNHAPAKSISDAAWGQLRALTAYKEVRKGGLVVNVPPRPTPLRSATSAAR